MPLETFPFDAAEHLNDAETIAWFISETLASGDPEEIADSLLIVERARVMHGIAGRGRTTPADNSTVRTGDDYAALFIILNELGFRLTIQAIEPEQPEAQAA